MARPIYRTRKEIRRPASGLKKSGKLDNMLINKSGYATAAFTFQGRECR
jgi:hypothetical protein